MFGIQFYSLATLSVTMVYNKRSFSLLNFLKMYLQLTMSTTQLTGLTLSFIYYDITITVFIQLESGDFINFVIKKCRLYLRQTVFEGGLYLFHHKKCSYSSM